MLSIQSNFYTNKNEDDTILRQSDPENIQYQKKGEECLLEQRASSIQNAKELQNH